MACRGNSPLLARMMKVQAGTGRKMVRRRSGGGGEVAREEMDVGEEARRRRLGRRMREDEPMRDSGEEKRPEVG